MENEYIGSNTGPTGLKRKTYSIQDKFDFYENTIQKSYIAPYKNKDIDGVLNDDQEHNIFYSPNYEYTLDKIDNEIIYKKSNKPISTVVVPTIPVHRAVTTMSQLEKLELEESKVYSSYIAPKSNRDIDGVLNDDNDHNIYYSPNYQYGADGITEYQQIIDDGGSGGECHCELVWEDM